MLSEFKKFISKGNVIDMAVGVVIGGAFGSIVSSLVNDIIMPAVGILTAGIDLKNLKIVLKHEVMEAGNVISPEVALTYGAFLQNIINFFIISASVFIFVKIISKFRKKEEPKPEPPKGPTQEELLAEIRDLLKEK